MTMRLDESPLTLSPTASLARLRVGNHRFASSQTRARDLLAEVAASAGGQHPFAVVLGCIDARLSVGRLFDQGVGDIVSVRVAGNVLSDDILGCVEFACKLAGTRLVVVLGHSRCGAVEAVCAGVELGHLTGLIEKIKPAVAFVEAQGPRDEGFVQRVAERNVADVVRGIRSQSPVIDGMVTAGEVGLVGAMYSVATGEVLFSEMVCGGD